MKFDLRLRIVIWLTHPWPKRTGWVKASSLALSYVKLRAFPDAHQSIKDLIVVFRPSRAR